MPGYIDTVPLHCFQSEILEAKKDKIRHDYKLLVEETNKKYLFDGFWPFLGFIAAAFFFDAVSLGAYVIKEKHFADYFIGIVAGIIGLVLTLLVMAILVCLPTWFFARVALKGKLSRDLNAVVVNNSCEFTREVVDFLNDKLHQLQEEATEEVISVASNAENLKGAIASLIKVGGSADDAPDIEKLNEALYKAFIEEVNAHATTLNSYVESIRTRYLNIWKMLTDLTKNHPGIFNEDERVSYEKKNIALLASEIDRFGDYLESIKSLAIDVDCQLDSIITKLDQ